MDKKLEFRIISPITKLETAPPKFVDMAIIPCTTGELGVLPGRLPCSMVLGNGNVRIVNDGVEYRLNVRGGIATISKDIITVLSNSVEWA